MVYENAINAIKALDSSSPDYEDMMGCIIKKTVHEEKHHVYRKIAYDLKYGPKKARAYKRYTHSLIDTFLKLKIETHKKFSSKPYDMQIYGKFIV